MFGFLTPSAAAETAPPPGWAVAVAIGLFVVVVTGPLVILNVLGDRRARRLLDDWARANCISLESVRAVYSYQRGPFNLRSRAASVFHITTRENRRGYVNMNNTFIWGCMPEVRWDDGAP